MRAVRAVASWAVVFACAVLGTVADARASDADTPVDSPARVPADTARHAGQAPGYASLFVRATDHYEPIVGSLVIIEGFKLGAILNEDGRATIDRIPAGRHVVRWQLIGYEPRRDTLVFVAGRQDTLLIRDPQPSKPNPDEFDLPASELGRPLFGVPMDDPLRQRLGVIFVAPDACFMATEVESLAPGTVVHALLLDASGSTPALRVVGRVAGPEESRLDSVYISTRARCWLHRLEWSDRQHARKGVGLGVLDLRGHARRVGTQLAVDLDGDGVEELVTSCAGGDGLELLIRRRSDRRLLWFANCAIVHVVRPTCTDEDAKLAR